MYHSPAYVQSTIQYETPGSIVEPTCSWDPRNVPAGWAPASHNMFPATNYLTIMFEPRSVDGDLVRLPLQL